MQKIIDRLHVAVFIAFLSIALYILYEILGGKWDVLITLTFAVLAISATVYQLYEDHKYKRLSVKPILKIHEDSDREKITFDSFKYTYTFYIQNVGLGTARLYNLQIAYGNQIISLHNKEWVTELESILNDTFTDAYKVQFEIKQFRKFVENGHYMAKDENAQIMKIIFDVSMEYEKYFYDFIDNTEEKFSTTGTYECLYGKKYYLNRNKK